MVPLNPNLKIFKKAVLERVKWFKLLFLNLVPLNTQNEITTKNTSESAVIKQIRQVTPLVIEKKWICKVKPLGEVYHFLSLVKLIFVSLLSFKLRLNSNRIIYRNKLKFIKLKKFKISNELDASKNTIIKYIKISI